MRLRGKEMEINSREINEEFNRMMERIGTVFFGEMGFANAQKYIRGLLGTAERKNGWQMSEITGESTPYKLQQFIYRGAYSANELRDKNREYIGEKIGEPDGVLVADDTGFIKQGEKSCGVKRQYSGTLGKVGNCQIGVFLTYASSKIFAAVHLSSPQAARHYGGLAGSCGSRPQKLLERCAAEQRGIDPLTGKDMRR